MKFLKLYYHYGFTLDNFFRYELYRDDMPLEEKLTYLPSGRLEHIWCTFNNSLYGSSFTNKYIFQCIAEANGLPVPEMYGIFDRYNGSDRRGKALQSAQDLQRLMDEKQLKDFVIKPVEGGQSKYVYALDYDAESQTLTDLQRGPISLQEIVDTLQDEKKIKASFYERGVAENYTSFIVQQRLRQDPALEEMTGPMLAPIRIVTLITSNGSIEVLASRIPILDHRKAKDVNDKSLISAAIDLETGEFQPGTYVKVESAEEVTSVETATRPFAGELCPHWRAAVELSKEAARSFSYCRSVGWDIAITPDGPLLLEGNTRWGVTTLQAAMKQGLLQGEFKKVYKELAGDRAKLAV
jgi:hypothetical protein